MAEIDKLLHIMFERGCSDLHLASGSRPVVRLHGDLLPLDLPALDEAALTRILQEICPTRLWDSFQERLDLDFAYAVPGVARFRANYLFAETGIAAVLRLIPDRVSTLEELGLPPILAKLALLDDGLILVTGPSGSGKSTTLAAMIDYANGARNGHIVTIEDPIEFIHTGKNCVFTHREVGTHTRSFANALRAALRQDPDIILVGEMRDLETMALALEAAATGHLVLGTLHTQSAARTFDRIIEVFPPNEQNQIRSTLAESIRGVVAQTLFKRIDEPKLCAALEILIATPAVRNLVRERQTSQLTSVMQMGKASGMQTLDEAILALLVSGQISPEGAYSACNDKERFRNLLRGPVDDPFEA